MFNSFTFVSGVRIKVIVALYFLPRKDALAESIALRLSVSLAIRGGHFWVSGESVGHLIRGSRRQQLGETALKDISETTPANSFRGQFQKGMHNDKYSSSFGSSKPRCSVKISMRWRLRHHHVNPLTAPTGAGSHCRTNHI